MKYFFSLCAHKFDMSFCFPVEFLQLCAQRLGHKPDSWTDQQALCWAKAGFQESDSWRVEGNFSWNEIPLI
jgi:hypothetical protein